jgi:hypothetical protein
MEKCEQAAGRQMLSAYVGIAGSHIGTRNSRGVSPVDKRSGVTGNDMQRALEGARAVALPENQEVIHTIELDGKATYLLTIVNQNQLQRMLERMHNESEFLSRYGIRSLSKYHEGHPFHMDGSSVKYEPAESAEKLKGGNSNWRGPLWFPTSFLIIESLRKLGTAFGPRYTLRTPGSHDEPINFWDMAHDIARRMIDIFLVNEHGVRPVWGGNPKFRTDPYWKDEVLFYEYFHGDNGAGIGASHQTGWTALVANLIDEWRRLPARR